MKLRDHLDRLLPEIMPPDEEPMTGREIHRQLKAQGFCFAEQSLYYALTQMSKDSASALQRWEHGHGYYWRQVNPETLEECVEAIRGCQGELAQLMATIEIIGAELDTAKALCAEMQKGGQA